jgi:hypothetical protein
VPFLRDCPQVVLLITLLAAQLGSVARPARAQAVKEDAAKAQSASADDSDELPAHFAEFADRLSGATLVGHFTMRDVDAEKPLHEERYEIRSVTKMGSGDYWLFQARIKYGDHDVTVPMPLEIKWAGKTPVITLDHVTIPKLGTFDARVVIDGTRYAGTWQHDDVGGHLFGRIEKPAQDTEPDQEAAAAKDEANE